MYPDHILEGHLLTTTLLRIPILCCSLCLAGGLLSLLTTEAASVGRLNFVFLESGLRQLFLDDFILGNLYRVERRIHQPTKHGAPVVQADHSWEKAPGPPWSPDTTTELIELWSPPSWDPEERVWKMWYSASEQRTGYARSQDGLRWEKPLLGRRDFRGSKQNNLVVVRQEPETYIQHALIDPDASAESRYKGLTGYRDRRPLVSSDGFEFSLLDVPPIPSQDQSGLIYDRLEKQFIATVKHRGPFGRSVYLCLSSDFRTWSQPELIFHADAPDQKLGEKRVREHLVNPGLRTLTVNVPEQYNTEIYNMPVFRYEGIYIGLPTYFESSGHSPNRNQEGVNSVKLSVSRDLRRWEKVGYRSSFIPVSEIGRGVVDTGQLLATQPVRMGEELWFYYSGINHRFTQKEGYRGGIHLARLRRDGFVSFRGDDRGGFVETREVRFDGRRLFLNADAEKGEIRVEVLERRGRTVLEDWSREQAQPWTGDHLQAEVRWQGQSSLEPLRGQTVRFRLYLKNADLFSFWIEN